MEGGNPVSIARTVQTSISPFGILVRDGRVSPCLGNGFSDSPSQRALFEPWIPRDFGSESRRGSGGNPSVLETVSAPTKKGDSTTLSLSQLSKIQIGPHWVFLRPR